MPDNLIECTGVLDNIKKIIADSLEAIIADFCHFSFSLTLVLQTTLIEKGASFQVQSVFQSTPPQVKSLSLTAVRVTY